MQNEINSPEEKLLKIIETPKDGGGSEGNKISNFFLGLSGAGGARLSDGFALKLGFRNLAYLLAAISLIFTLIFALDFTRNRFNFQKRFKEVVNAKVEPVENEIRRMANLDLASSLAIAKKRDIFTMKPQASNVSADAVAKGEKTISSLRLVGILWSANPEALIEDNSDNKTHLLHEGDSIDKWQIKNIFQDKIILENEQGQWELK
ncbi:MAG: hypothetical protein GY858_09225 [Candidatus Omnitrophica bacterium]|nr:hypothetical protein [Candidatus Omnitrophota bacterium]